MTPSTALTYCGITHTYVKVYVIGHGFQTYDHNHDKSATTLPYE